MALSAQTYQGDGTNTDFVLDFTLGYISTAHIYVLVDEVEIPQNTLQFILGGGSVRLSTPPANGAKVLVRRIVPNDALIHDYENGALVIEKNLDESNLQAVMLQHQAQDGFSTDEGRQGNLNMGTYKVVNSAPGETSGELVEYDQFIEGLSNLASVGIIPRVQPRQQGDGTTTNFSTPSDKARLAQSFFIHLDGISQRPYTDFLINLDGTVTFDEAPAKGVDIDIVLFEPANVQQVVDNSTVLSTDSTAPRTLADRFADIVNVKDFGAVGDGVADDTIAIQTAINSGSYIVVPEGDYLVSATPGITLTSKKTLEFYQGAQFRVKPENNPAYQCILVLSATDVTIINPTLVGDRTSNTGTGEWGHGLAIMGGTNVTIINPTVTDMFGDGVYLGRNYSPDGTTFVTVPEIANINTTFIGAITAHNNRRNNVSLISVDGFYADVMNLTKDITGTAPDAGIDFEPNAPAELMTNIYINSINTKGHRGSGTTIGMRNSDGTTPHMSIDIKNITSDDDRDFFFANDGEISGTINIDNLYITRALHGGLQLEKLDNLGAMSITFGKVTVIDCNTSGEGSTRLGSAFALWRNTAATAQPLGGISVEHLYIDSPDSINGVYFADASGTPNIERPITIKYIERIVSAGLAITSSGVINGLDDPFGYLTKVLEPLESSNYPLSLSDYQTVVKTHETKSTVVNLPPIAADNIGYQVKLLMLDATGGLSRVNASASDVLKIDAAVAGQLDTTARGASIELLSTVTGWEVLNISGQWT